MDKLVNDGQIQYNDPMGQVIAQYASDTRFKLYLEIGTWNGGGSTYCFAKGFENRTEPFYFLTLETNKELYEEAKAKYTNIKYIHIENASIIQISDISNINIILEKFKDLNAGWLHDDLNNLRAVKRIEFDNQSPEVVLLDGSEYLTYFEYLRLRYTTKVFILDDINTDKCRDIVSELDSDNSWRCIHKVKSERNGWAVYERID